MGLSAASPGPPATGPGDVDLEALREDLLRAGGELAGTVTGRSMAPLLLPGDRLLVRAPARPAGPGDILAFRRGSAWVVHRCLARRGALLLERGDHAGRPATVPETLVPGIVVAVERGGRRLDLTRGPVRRAGRLAAAAGRLSLVLEGRDGRDRPLPWARAVCGILARLAWRFLAREATR